MHSKVPDIKANNNEVDKQRNPKECAVKDEHNVELTQEQHKEFSQAEISAAP
eukprot:Pgem_evm1s13170